MMKAFLAWLLLTALAISLTTLVPEPEPVLGGGPPCLGLEDTVRECAPRP